MQDGSFRTQRLLYTDSGHYLLPIHHFNKPADENLARTHHDHRHNLTFPVALHEENDANKDDTHTEKPVEQHTLHTTLEEQTASQVFH